MGTVPRSLSTSSAGYGRVTPAQRALFLPVTLQIGGRSQRVHRSWRLSCVDDERALSIRSTISRI